MENHEHSVKGQEDSEIEIFLQGEGISDMLLIKLSKKDLRSQLSEIASSKGFPFDGSSLPHITLEDRSEALELHEGSNASEIKNRSRLHIHRCKKVQVTVNFNSNHKSESFPPSATIKKVFRWAVGNGSYNLLEIDALEHTLQICGSNTRPDEDIHIGSLVNFPECSVCFDLVPKIRVEG